MFSFDTKREEKCGGACKAWKPQWGFQVADRFAQQSHSDFDALEPRKRGCSPLLTPKRRATPEKTEDSRLFGVKIF